MKKHFLISKMLEFILNQVKLEYKVDIDDIEDITLNNDAMYIKLINGSSKIVMLYPDN